MHILVNTILILFIPKADSTNDIICNGTKIIGNALYEVQKLKIGFGKCYNLVMHQLSGNLFFSHNCCNKKQFYLRIVSCHLASGVCANVSGIAGGYAVYHYKQTDEIYFGSYDGIYRYDITTNSARFIGARNKIIWCIFIINNVLFYIDYPSFKLYSLQSISQELPIGHKQYSYYFVSKGFDHYYTNKAKELYKIKNSSRFDEKPILLDRKITVRQITEDVYGTVYICTKNGLFVEDELTHRLKKYADFGKVFGMTITNIYDVPELPDMIKKKDLMIIYSDGHDIYKVYPSKYSQYCLISNVAGKQITRSLTNKLRISFSATIDYD